MPQPSLARRPPSPREPPALQCSHCGRSLSMLAQRSRTTHCDTSACRQRADAARQAVARQDAAQALTDRARCLLGPASATVPAVVWLEPHATELVPVTAAQHAALQTHLQRVLAEGLHLDIAHPEQGDASAGTPQAHRLCEHCAGRCCRHGASTHAFIDLDLVQRWSADTGLDLAEAANTALALLPAVHVADSCLFHTAQGCALPRERRADVCNHYACDTLKDVQSAVHQDPQAAVLTISLGPHGVEAAAVITAQTLHRLQV